jgi:hypothetical protein
MVRQATEGNAIIETGRPGFGTPLWFGRWMVRPPDSKNVEGLENCLERDREPESMP